MKPIKSYTIPAAMATALAALVSAQPVLADSTPTPKQLMQMIEAQQKQLNAMKAALAQSQKQAESAAKQASEAAEASKKSFMNNVTVGGVAEVEMTSTSGFDNTDTSDIALATVEVFVDAQLHDYLSTHVQLIYEDAGDAFNFDEASVTVGNTEKHPLYLTFGRIAQPFGGQGGGFDTHMSSDTLTKSLGETKEAAIEVGAVYQGLHARGYIYNGDTQKAGEGNNIDQFGLAASYGGEANGAAYNVGVSYINNIADSDGLTALAGVGTALVDYVAGFEVHGDISYNDFLVRGGYMTALDEFAAGEVAFNGQGAEPSVWHLEAAYTTQIMGKDTTFAATVQGSDEALALGLPETRYGGAVTVGIVDNFSITAEYLHDEDYSTADGGTGEDGNTATLKLAAEF